MGYESFMTKVGLVNSHVLSTHSAKTAVIVNRPTVAFAEGACEPVGAGAGAAVGVVVGGRASCGVVVVDTPTL